MLITIAQLEALAGQIETDDKAEHTRLLRLCNAMGRILVARQPEVWRQAATSITDVAGHFDGSYPPKEEHHYSGGPRVVRVRGRETEDVPTESGFYHAWRRQTTDEGCYLGRDGHWYSADESGTGRVGQYAAHPGDRDRDITVEWRSMTPTLEDLRAAEPVLRELMATFLEGSTAA